MTKQITCGSVKIGGGAPVSIQSMTNVNTADIPAARSQIRQLEEAGCEIVRLAVPDMDAAEVFKELKKTAKVPLVADIHFDYRLALAAIRAGADKIRINPGNIGEKEKVRQVADAAKAAGIPIRVGVNSGSLEADLLKRDHGPTAKGLAESALRNAEVLEDMGFSNIILSLKSSNVKMNYDAYRMVAAQSDYPLHIGVTEAGTVSRGKIKSAVGIGALLLAGIGDTMRVSLTADPAEEVFFAKELLLAAGLRESGIDLVSCPTCGRTKVDLESIALEIERALDKYTESSQKRLKVAVMGCAVNGPGEAKDADLGVACGDGKGIIFSRGNIIKTVSESQIAREMIRMVKDYETI
ncbi:MAG: flavodoxin-dependent (E)-4-hydroxy-3-methylbut-2-enyl-diphosphate synthase [Firmicutes bacterium]|nr:flavodoxin-dependent (E)-4-hydroxy-3-methylbut-2-enyl-diphosphate synthase [Bacillota bacterium]